MFITNSEVNVIDQEWVALILEAKKLGISIEDVREFLNQDSLGEPSGTY
ncbi:MULTISPECIES: anti-repressor SinI family protein [Bacillaceae]|nr:anti-repressor SinI family protein [Bacillus sp. S3]QCJ41490.1 DNA-binding anti-repressor SinI [Bacillus sp. S3]